MSKDWHDDIDKMHVKFGVHDWVGHQVFDQKTNNLEEFLKFRIGFLREELDETEKAFYNKDAEEVIDGLIDLCVVAIGTLNAFDVDAHAAWQAVHDANMTKEAGVKPERPNPLGVPDMIKPPGWVGPSHEGNHGIIGEIFDGKHQVS